ncbi:toll/interleukin-1 receptor (TIR) domain-containing protein [Artemisia annua]|uniref:Toll/interleukin-1 receptor (TIR) domain-containing protein n=1 Tax=Artemisia annua TaxID=35608 RepID=A0A2U1PUF9_ARTAN|nr:toll/interleukin-1 receptor (TIR) domain-containing protein [Artemisia annua]
MGIWKKALTQVANLRGKEPKDRRSFWKKYCEGLPLALEVLGKFLHNRDAVYWDGCIKWPKKEPKMIKDLSKRIACFFVGKDRVFSETILKACDMSTHSGISNLIDRCLLSIGWSNELVMHQLVQEMGRYVVRQESPNKPWKRSRLWCHKESFKVLKQKKGTEKVLSLILDMRLLEKKTLQGSFELKIDAFSNMDSLVILHLDNVQIKGSFENFPKELRWLTISNLLTCPVSRPQPFKGRHMLTSWLNARRLLGSLKIHKLSHCYQLRSLGGFHELPLLEMLFLKNCMNLSNVCESIQNCD